MADSTGPLSIERWIRLATTEGCGGFRTSTGDPSSLRKSHLLVRAHVHSLTGCNRGYQFDGGHHTPVAFPELGALRRHAKNPYAWVVFVGPKRLVVDGPVLLDPIPIVNHLRMTGNRHVFLALVV